MDAPTPIGTRGAKVVMSAFPLEPSRSVHHEGYYGRHRLGQAGVPARAVIRENFSFPHHPATASSLRSCASVLRAGASCSTAANCCGQAWQRSASSQTLRSRLSVIRCPRSRQDAPRSRNQLAEKPLGLINPGDRESITFFIVTDYFQRLVFHIFIFL